MLFPKYNPRLPDLEILHITLFSLFDIYSICDNQTCHDIQRVFHFLNFRCLNSLRSKYFTLDPVQTLMRVSGP
jgi:hypothetical protein